MDPRSLRKQRELEARRDEILSAAECLFSKHGFFKTSMAEIAGAAQFAMGTLYRFFKSKEDIYISLVEAKVEELMSLLEERVSQASTAKEKIEGGHQGKAGLCGQESGFLSHLRFRMERI